MKRILPTLITIFAFTTMWIGLPSCGPDRPEPTPDQIAREKEAVKKVIEEYNKASEEKNFGDLVKTLAGEVTFFGTDSGEVITTFADFKKAIQAQWQEYDITKYGPLTDVFIEMDPTATFASVICGVPLTTKRGGLEENYYLRLARTLRKEDNRWVIVSGISSIARNVPHAVRDGQVNLQGDARSDTAEQPIR